MKNAMRMGILAVTIVLLASVAMLASPASADGTQDDAVLKGMSAEEFLSLAGEGKSIVMEEDVKLTSALKIATEIELDLNGHKLVSDATHTIWVADGGKLTVKGAGTVDCQKHGCAALYVDVGGEAILNGGTFERSLENGTAPKAGGTNSWYTIYNAGTVTINDGTTVLNGDAETTGRFSSMIVNGFPKPGLNTNKVNAVLTINGGNFVGGLYNVKCDDYGVVTINGGSFKASSGLSNVLAWNDLTVSGGDFQSDMYAIQAYDTAELFEIGKIAISGGTYANNQAVVNLGMFSATSDAVYTLDIALDGMKEGTKILETESGAKFGGKVSINGNAVELNNLTAGAGFALAVGSIDISGAYTSTEDGAIVVNGDAKLSGLIDSSVTVTVESGSITVPEGKTLVGTIQMGESNEVELYITAGKGGLTVTPTTIGGATAGSGSIDIVGKVSVKGALTLGEVELSVPAESELSIPKGASVSGGKVENAGSIIVDGAVESTIANSGRVSAAVDAKVSDVEGGDFEQEKPVIERKVFDANVPVGGLVTFSVTVTEGASVKLTGVTWATYKDGVISGKPTETGEYKITATPFIGDNIGESIVFTVNVYESTDPVTPVEPDKDKEKETNDGSFNFATVAIVLIFIALVLFAITRLI